MILPSMAADDGIRKHKQVQFGGLDRNPGAREGALQDMRNLTAADHPLLAVRPKRQILRQLNKPNGLFAWGKLMWVDGTDLYYDGEIVGQVSDSKKTFCALGNQIVILPDKVCYHTEEKTLEALEVRWRLAYSYQDPRVEVTLRSGNQDVYIRVIGGSGDFADAVFAPLRKLREGDVITMYDSDDDEEPFTAMISGTEDMADYSNERRFRIKLMYPVPEGAAFGGSNQSSDHLPKIERVWPELVDVCADGNRLWGCSKDTIHATKLGDPYNWNVFDGVATDSWTVTPGSPGDFTGCCNFQGYPTFFKEDGVYKVYGSVPSDFQTVDTPLLGPAAGCQETMAVVGDLLLYLGSSGMMAYGGSVAQVAGQAFGAVRFVGGVAGTDGLNYYGSLKDTVGATRLCVYDGTKGLWHIEDELEAISMCRLDGCLYCLDSRGKLWILGQPGKTPEGSQEEEAVHWLAEFADFAEQEPNQKGIGKLQLRLELEDGASMTVWLQFDSDGVWHPVATVKGEGGKRNYYLPIVPRRCDHFRLKLTGSGHCRVYSLVREVYVGSERGKR